MKGKDLLIDTDIIRKSVEVLRAINNNFRQELIKLLHKHKKCNVTFLYTTLKWEQVVVSQHLRILREADFIIAERDGREIYYSLNFERFAYIDKLIKKILK